MSTEEQSCELPAGFVSSSPPDVAPLNSLVARIEKTVINRPLEQTLASLDEMTLEDAIDPESPLPHVVGTHVLTDGEFKEEGSRRVVFLSDESTLIEEVLQLDTTDSNRTFRYVVWNYSTKAARPIDYGVGEFIHAAVGNEQTAVQWTYAFALKQNVFPGSFGAVGRWLFRVSFLDRQYARMMQGTLARSKAWVESSN